MLLPDTLKPSLVDGLKIYVNEFCDVECHKCAKRVWSWQRCERNTRLLSRTSLSHKLMNSLKIQLCAMCLFYSLAVRFPNFNRIFALHVSQLLHFFFYCCPLKNILEGFYSTSLPFQLHCSCGNKTSSTSGSHLQHNGT